MKLAEFSIKNSLLVNLISVFIILAGISAMLKIPRDAFPQVDFDVVTVTTAYPGAPAEDVEKFVTIPIEKELKGISGIKEIESSSDEGIAVIGITIDPNTSDKDQVVDDIKEAVDRVRDLPAGVKDDPLVVELKSKERPILEISISGNHPEGLKRQYAENLEDELLLVDGVASVRRIGWRDREFWVEVDPKKLREYYVSTDEIIAALRKRNITLPGGQVTTGSTEYNVRVTSEFTTAKQIEDVVIRANDSGNWLKIKDVAVVKDTFEDETRIAKINKKHTVAMVVVKSETGDVLKISRKVKELLPRFEELLPEGMEITITNDFSYYVNRRLGVLKNNGIIGFILVLLMLFLFLSPTPAIVTAFGIPIAFFVTFISMYLLGININLVSMLGLIIVLGMLVDDGIIVAENVYRYIENGMPVREAAVKGTQEVIRPVTVTILTTCAAFAPLLFMSDIIGKFIKEIPMIVMIALSASLFEAFIILPAHLADFISLRRNHVSVKKNKTAHQRWYGGLIRSYTKLLHFVLNHRYKLVFGLLVPLLVVSLFIGSKMKFVFVPGQGIEEFDVRFETEKGTPLRKMNELVEPIEDAVAQLPKDEMEDFRTYLGSIESGRRFDPNAKRGTHLGSIKVFLTPYQTRKRSTQEISEDLREKIKDTPGFKKIYVYRRKPGPPVGRAVSVAIRGERYEVLEEISQKFTDYLKTIPGVSDIDTSYEFGKKQLIVEIDEAKAQKYFLTMEQIANSVRTAYKGSVATSVRPLKAEEEIDVLVRFSEDQRENLKSFEEILLSNTFGKLVPLSAVAKIVEKEGVYNINHLDGKRVIYVIAEVDDKQATSLDVNKKLKERFGTISKDYLGYSAKFSGEFEEQQESRRNLLLSFGFALGIIFIILTAMFNSLIQPFIVMLAIPFGIVGVILAFLAHGQPLSFFGLIGLVGLTGIVVNDSIVLVDFVNRLRKEGKDRRDSLIEAGQLRLRPVIMTSLTTIGGLVSVAYGIGGGDPFLKPMALAIVWGLLFSTILILVIIPCIYAIFDDLTEKFLHHAMVKTGEGEKEVGDVGGDKNTGGEKQ